HSSGTTEKLALGGLASFGAVVAFAINGGDLAAHWPKIRRKLAPVMNRMVQRDLCEADGRQLKQPAKINNLDQPLAVKLPELLKAFCEPIRIVDGDIGACLRGIRPRLGAAVESSIEHGVEKANFGRGDVPGEFKRRLGVEIGSIVGLGRRYGFDDAFRGAMFVLQGTQQYVVQPEFGMFDRHCFHDGSSVSRLKTTEIATLTGRQSCAQTDVQVWRLVTRSVAYGLDRPASHDAREYSTLRARSQLARPSRLQRSAGPSVQCRTASWR